MEATKNDLFQGISCNESDYIKNIRRSPSKKDYVVFFTPRSGSSWLGSLLSGTGALGRPGEYFNKSFVARNAAALNAPDLASYIAALRRRRTQGGIFGTEITGYQIRAVFGSNATFSAFFPPATKSIYLIREDIVLQGISLAKSKATAVFHSVSTTPEQRAKSDAVFEYDSSAIEKSINHIARLEQLTETMIRRYGYQPLRLSYEKIFSMRPKDVIGLISTHLEEPHPEVGVDQIDHNKIGTSKNEEFSVRFRKENSRFVEEVEAKRRKLLFQLNDAQPNSSEEKMDGTYV